MKPETRDTLAVTVVCVTGAAHFGVWQDSVPAGVFAFVALFGLWRLR